MAESSVPKIRKFVFLTDLHFGYERDSYRHKRPIHDTKALSVALQFTRDFQPTDIILGGDMLDCGCISSHRKREGSGRTEGLRLLADAKELRTNFLEQVEQSRETRTFTYITGNHEAWLDQLVDQDPGLEGIVDLKSILNLGNNWKVIPQGESHDLGKLTFIHGDQFGGGDHVAKAAVLAYERSVRFGHFHTLQTYTKTSALDIKQGKTGMVVPCLSTKNPKWVRGAPNKWCQGFLYGYVRRDGTFNDYPVVIVNGKAIIEGKEYVG